MLARGIERIGFWLPSATLIPSRPAHRISGLAGWPACSVRVAGLLRDAGRFAPKNALAGRNDYHKVETLFKALARALDEATRIDERIPEEIPSTKGTMEA